MTMRSNVAARGKHASQIVRTLDWPSLDALAWTTMSRWQERLEEMPVYRGLDLAELARFFLWDKVARALRGNRVGAGWEPHPNDPVDRQLLFTQWGPRAAQARDSYFQNLKRIARRLAGQPRLPVVYAPVWCDRLGRTAAALLERGNVEVVTTTPLPMADERIRRVEVNYPPIPNLGRQARGCCAALKRCLLECGADLNHDDEAMLRRQMHQLLVAIWRTELDFDRVRPDLVLVYADNHPPSQIFVRKAQQLGIPTVMLQHGLDCEQYCLSAAYADHLLLWGPARRRRYAAEAGVNDDRMHVIGNPEWDERSIAATGSGGPRWLWTTRPHASLKCYLPSQLPQDGLDVFCGLLSALAARPEATLVVKTHPLDYHVPYENLMRLAGSAVGTRVRFETRTKLATLLDDCDVQISEDSTALLEGALAGKPLVHVTPRRSPSVFPELVDGAALVCRRPDELPDALMRASSLDDETRTRMKARARLFIADHAGPQDGQAARRAAAVIERLLLKRKV